jgi:Protein of unknown function (DUF4013)
MSEMSSVPPPPPPPPDGTAALPPPPPILPPLNETQFDFGKPFTFVFDDPRWLQKIGIGGLFYLAAFFLIGWFFILGYCSRLARNVITGQQYPLPEWDDLGEMFSEGARLIGVGLIYIAPLMIVAMSIMIPSIAMSSTDSEFAQVVGSGMAGCLWCLMVPLSLAVMLFLPASLLFASVEQRFGAAFEFGRIWAFIKNNIGNYLLAVLVYLIARFLGSFGIALFCVGVIFTAFWAMLVQTYGFAQVYRIAVTKK